MDKAESTLYKTSTLPLAVCLSLIYPLKSIEKGSDRNLVFVFEETKDLLDSIELYWNKQLQVEPQSFFSRMRELKARLYEQV
ncbi:hypothetical protein A3K34_00870 [candidate division WWE3 bacterium RIFOXYC1_FULL_40_10]|uniref:DUF5659 domain-containing protein n=1 Tax=candidate division WWE3 bacterium RIFOXYA2_FULL_46_9 TaxID=1802636 RepID=A0A1F4W1W9_UNCKA|nr:MAG: hypothetical protein A3K58_00870 [candidate division WWE3 bacterium RIFOXYB1_FULL_40_22]OGC61427.1 MAG: hypothetical protein A3K37_00870 [candidate division WWE3 bacterium RIFOXYA1_FULL_40_11]OGC63360.1 MAG: hypothetical protein A2264_01345 [candidate division WWE3 bacterium RIFOXYA2_FULL_46_9]OGC65434.1 MAG: hypothetical protein A2326_00120 [candidate division WWE3 bacterium RIFOXYB2_FULL_41_6]OGC65810.1 MAG: hypothetical protein A3K34_00870 [candidate division WWE3 bacterium RIFOXYC1_